MEKVEFIVEKILHLGVIAVIVWSFLFIDFTGRGRIWDKLTGHSVSAADAAALSAPGKAILTKDSDTDRLLIDQPAAAPAAPAAVVEERPQEPSATELAAQVPVLKVRAQAKAPKRHLSSSLADIDDSSRASTQKTSASAGGGAAARRAPSATDTQPNPAYLKEQPEPGSKQGAVATRNSRGAARADMMGRADAPVYNFNGKSSP